MKVLFVASECAPFIKTGGLADVVSALPKALAEAGVSVRILLPAYPALSRVADKGKEVLSLRATGLGTLKVRVTRHYGIKVLVGHLHQNTGQAQKLLDDQAALFP